jgi:hypothetical protein
MGVLFDKLVKFYRNIGLVGALDRQAYATLEMYVLQVMQSPRYQDPRRLLLYEHQNFSRGGVDGSVAEIFRRIGTQSKTFVEVGCGDGLENNTTNLLWSGWNGFWFDGSEENIHAVRKNVRTPLADGSLRVSQAFFNAENVAGIFEQAGVPREFDFLSIDIDRNTYYVWEALAPYRPRAVVVEYNAKVLPSCDWKVRYDPQKTWNHTGYMGASLKALENLGRKLGYELVGCDLMGSDAYFVRADLDLTAFASPFTAENHFEPPRYFLWRHSGHIACFED